jgi:hypothetical protein
VEPTSLDTFHIMSYNTSTAFCMPPPVSPIPSYGQASSRVVGGRTDQYNAAPVNGNPPTSPHWVSPTQSLGNPFSFDSAYSHSSYVSGYASPLSPHQYPSALNYPDEKHMETARENASRSAHDIANEDVRDYKSNVHVERENGASDKALMLLQETVGVDVVCTAGPIESLERNPGELDYDVMSDPGQYQKSSTNARNRTSPPSKDDSNDAKCFKNGFDVVRERGANLKALALLEQTVGYDISDVAKSTSIYLHKPTLTAAEESYNIRQKLKADYKAKKRAEKEFEEQKMLKEEELFEANNSNGKADFSEEETSSKHVRAKMVAEFRAKKKLEKYAGGARESIPESPCTRTYTIEHPISPEEETITKPSVDTEINHSGRSAIVATVPDEELTSKQLRAKIIAEYKAKKKLDKTVGYKVADKESLAETSRVPKSGDGSNTNDPETIAGMKCDIDIERENIAMKKALQLLNDRPGLMA